MPEGIVLGRPVRGGQKLSRGPMNQLERKVQGLIERCESLEERVQKLEEKRRPGRPPKDAA